MPRSITPRRRPGPLVLGHFTRSRGYSSWRPEGTRDWLLICGVSGQGRVGTPEGDRAIEPGRLVLFAPGTPQDYGLLPAAKHWELLWAHFLPPAGWAELLLWPEWSPGLKTLFISDRKRRGLVIAALKRACELSARRLQRRQDFAWNALHEALLWCDVHNPHSEESRLDPRVRRALDFITGDVRHPFTLAELARIAGLSPTRMIALFHTQLGQTPRQFWEGRRIEQARRLLERTQLSVAEIAEAVGYTDPFYFSTRFKVVVGSAPRAYRQSAAEPKPD